MNQTADLRSAAYDAANYLSSIFDSEGVDDRGDRQPLAALRRALRGPDAPYVIRAAVRALITAGGIGANAMADVLAKRAEDTQADQLAEIGKNLVAQDIGSNVGNVVEYLMGKCAGESGDPFDDEERHSLSYRPADEGDYREELDDDDYRVVQGIDPSDGAQAWFWHAVDKDEPNDGAPAAEDAEWFETEQEAFENLFNSECLDRPDGSEIYEYWLVSNYLGEKLEARGESVVETDFFHQPIWGRATTGQAIRMDGVIKAIALELLEAGQEAFTDEDDDRVAAGLILLDDIKACVEPSTFRAEAGQIMRDLASPRLQGSFAVACEVRFGFDPRDL